MAEHNDNDTSASQTLGSSYITIDHTPPPSHSSSTVSISDLDKPLMTKFSPPANKSVVALSSPSSPTSHAHKSRKDYKKEIENDKASWPNGKRPRGYRTSEGKELAEKSKNYKSGVSIPHLSAPCNTYQGVLTHALLGAIRTCYNSCLHW